MSNNDLLKYTTSDIDFYALLNLDPNTFTPSELRRAYRKTALKYHPDKVGDAFDAEKYEQFQAANEILGDAELKAKYDGYRNAKLQKKRAADLLDGKRRSMRDDLEARERGVLGKRGREEESEESKEAKEEFRKMMQKGREERERREKRKSMVPAEDIKSDPVPEPEKKKEQKEESVDEKIARLERELAESLSRPKKKKARKEKRKAADDFEATKERMRRAEEGARDI